MAYPDCCANCSIFNFLWPQPTSGSGANSPIYGRIEPSSDGYVRVNRKLPRSGIAIANTVNFEFVHRQEISNAGEGVASAIFTERFRLVDSDGVPAVSVVREGFVNQQSGTFLRNAWQTFDITIGQDTYSLVVVGFQGYSLIVEDNGIQLFSSVSSQQGYPFVDARTVSLDGRIATQFTEHPFGRHPFRFLTADATSAFFAATGLPTGRRLYLEIGENPGSIYRYNGLRTTSVARRAERRNRRRCFIRSRCSNNLPSETTASWVVDSVTGPTGVIAANNEGLPLNPFDLRGGANTPAEQAAEMTRTAEYPATRHLHQQCKTESYRLRDSQINEVRIFSKKLRDEYAVTVTDAESQADFPFSVSLSFSDFVPFACEFADIVIKEDTDAVIDAATGHPQTVLLETSVAILHWSFESQPAGTYSESGEFPVVSDRQSDRTIFVPLPRGGSVVVSSIRYVRLYYRKVVPAFFQPPTITFGESDLFQYTTERNSFPTQIPYATGDGLDFGFYATGSTLDASGTIPAGTLRPNQGISESINVTINSTIQTTSFSLSDFSIQWTAQPNKVGGHPTRSMGPG